MRGKVFGQAIAIALVGLFLGWVAGYGIVRPSENEVREAAETLVPPGATVVERSSGGSDWSPLRASFRANVELELSAELTSDEVVDRARLAAERADWHIAKQERTPAGRKLYVEKRTLDATVSLRYHADPPVSGNVRVGRRLDVISTVERASGVAVAIAAVMTWWWRRRRDSAATGHARRVHVCCCPAIGSTGTAGVALYETRRSSLLGECQDLLAGCAHGRQSRLYPDI